MENPVVATGVPRSSVGSVQLDSASYREISDAYKFRAENAIDTSLKIKIASALGYDAAAMASIPSDANIGEGCGNPLIIAGLSEGQTVVDLGCGGGFDCFQASRQVGPLGKVVGLDMTKEMIDLANRNASKMDITNVEFIHTNINKIPLDDNSVDCVISNCVLNLVPDADKLNVIKEIHRILKPCGRLAISDFLALKEFTQEMKEDPALRAGCVSGSTEVEEMKDALFLIGFDDVLLVNTEKDLNLYKDGEMSKSVTPCCAGSSCGPAKLTKSGRKEVDYDLNEWIASFQMYGHKWCGKTKQNPPQVIKASQFSGTQPLEKRIACSSSSKNIKGCC